jgi:hypothetical protein
MSEPTGPSSEFDDFDRALLGSAELDRPATGAVTRAAAALGIPAVIAPAAVAAAATGVAGRAATFSFTKWTLIGALGVAGVGTGTVAYLGSTGGVAPRATVAPAVVNAPPRGDARPAAPAAQLPTASPELPASKVAPPSPRHAVVEQTPARGGVQPPVAPAAAAPAVAAFPSDPASAVAAAPSPGAAPAAGAARDAASAAAPSPGGGVSIADEVALVERARHALRQGRAGEAFDTLSLHQSRWPNGVLATEVRVLRVEALLRMGQRASAQSDARAFIAVQPNSRYAARLRALFAPGELD